MSLVKARIVRTHSLRRWWQWPWLHWCLWDTDCQDWGNPRRIYIHLFGCYIEFGEDEDSDEWAITQEAFDRRMKAAAPAELIDPPERES